jgi:hypothetical protein
MPENQLFINKKYNKIILATSSWLFHAQNITIVRAAKRVRDAEGGVSQCGEQRSTKRSEAHSSPTRRETPKV